MDHSNHPVPAAEDLNAIQIVQRNPIAHDFNAGWGADAYWVGQLVPTETYFNTGGAVDANWVGQLLPIGAHFNASPYVDADEIRKLAPIGTSSKANRDPDFNDEYLKHIFELRSDYSLTEARLESAKAQLSEACFPSFQVDVTVRPETSSFPWLLPFDDDILSEHSTYTDVTTERFEQWDRLWRVSTLCRIWWQDFAGILQLKDKERWQVLVEGLRLLLKKFGRPLFPFQLLSRERDWCLLHGSHPPRQNAGIPIPVFAQLERVCWQPQDFLA